MGPVEARRSQPLLRLPVDRWACELILEEGSRLSGFLFLAPGSGIAGLLDDSKRFLPMLVDGSVRLVTRAAIACIVFPAGEARRRDPGDELPGDRQQAAVRLRSGLVIDGELRWIACPECVRTIDFLNQPDPWFPVHGVDAQYLIAKLHVAWVEEA